MDLRSALALALALAACGGQVEQDPSTDASPWSGAPLGQCVIGAPPAAGDCPYLADGRCYANKQAACNCICPRDHDSWCVTDLGDPATTTVFVSCN